MDASENKNRIVDGNVFKTVNLPLHFDVWQ